MVVIFKIWVVVHHQKLFLKLFANCDSTWNLKTLSMLSGTFNDLPNLLNMCNLTAFDLNINLNIIELPDLSSLPIKHSDLSFCRNLMIFMDYVIPNVCDILIFRM